MDTSSLHSLPSTTSTTASVAFSSLTPAQIQILQAIIDRVSPTAATFLAIYSEYQKVLKENNLNSEEDTEFYGILLKLSMVSGDNWIQKWKTVKDRYFSHVHVQPNGHTKPYLKSQAARSGFNAKSLLTTPSSTPRRIRQFLVPAATNISETTDADSDFQPPHTPFLLQKQLRLTEGAGSSTTTGPSPPSVPSYRTHGKDVRIQVLPSRLSVAGRKARSLASEGGKERDQTPLHSTPAPGKRGKSPKDERHTHVGFESFAVETVQKKRRKSAGSMSEADRRKIRGEAERQRRFDEKVNEEQREKVLLERRMREEDKIQKEERERQLREEKRLENEAESFRRLALIGRRWDHWYRRTVQSRWDRQLLQRFALASDRLTLRHSLTTWHIRLSTLQSLQRTADKRYSSSLMEHFFIRWRKHVKFRKEARLRAAWSQVRGRWKRRWARKVWDTWRWKVKERQADQHNVTRILGATFTKWKRGARSIHRIEVLGANLSFQRDEKLEKKVWSDWRRKVKVLSIERILTQKRAKDVLSKSLGVWKQRTFQNRMSLSFRVNTLRLSALRKWRQQLSLADGLHERLFDFCVIKERVLTFNAFHRWRLKMLSQQFDRRRNDRVLKRTFARWRLQKKTISDLEDREYQFRQDLNYRLKSSVLSLWTNRLATHQNALSIAVTTHSRSVIVQTLNLWSKKRHRIRKLKHKAKQARNVFLMARVWNVWHARLTVLQRDRWIQRRNQRIKTDFFTTWKEKHFKVASLQEYVEDFDIRINHRLALETLRHWYDKTVDVRERGVMVERVRRKKLLRLAFSKWTIALKRHAELNEQAHNYRQHITENHANSLFVHWFERTVEIRERRRKYKERKATRRRKVMTNCFTLWKDRYRERTLANLEVATRQAYENRLTRTALGKWVGVSKNVVAIRFCNQHLQLRTFIAWKRAVPKRQDQRLADSVSQKNLQLGALQTWLTKYRARRVVRAANRFRGKTRKRSSIPSIPSVTNFAIPQSSPLFVNVFDDNSLIINRRPPSEEASYTFSSMYPRAPYPPPIVARERARTASPTRSPVKTTSRPSSRLSRVSNYERQREKEEEEWQEQVRTQMRGMDRLSRNANPALRRRFGESTSTDTDY